MTVARNQNPFEYWRDRDWLTYAVHELPIGVLYGANGATAEQCVEMLEGLNGFARLCARVGLDDHRDFVEACRWHFEHYPHYLERRRHFVDYPTYIADRNGPLTVPPPPQPPRFLRRL